jgi:hypothetical protein
MPDISFCPYRTQVTYDPSAVQTTQFEVQTTQFDLQTTKYEEPVTFTGTSSDLELLEACKSGSEQPPKLEYQVGKNMPIGFL